MEPTGAQLFQERAKLFLDNVWSLWTEANNDQRIFLGILVGIMGIYSLIALRHIRWRIINRQEIKKVRHYAMLKSVLTQDQELCPTRSTPTEDTTSAKS